MLKPKWLHVHFNHDRLVRFGKKHKQEYYTLKFLSIFVEKFYIIDIQSILLYVLTHNTNKPLIHFDHCSTVQNVKADFYSVLSYS